MLIPTAEPFLRIGSSPLGVVLIHGFTGTPKEMRGLGEYLAEQGFSVLGVRLAGHATRMDDMRRMHYRDWIADVESGYHLLRGVSSQVALVGLSMGGVLALRLAPQLEICGVAALSTPYRLPRSIPDWMMRLAALVRPYWPKGGEPGSGWFDRQAWQEHVAYPYNPTRAILELKHLLAEMWQALPQVRVPVLLIHSRDDEYVPRESMEQIHARLGSAHKEMCWISGGGHVITEEPTRTVVYPKVAEFLHRLEQLQ